MDVSQDFKSFQEKVQAALVAATRSANQIAAEDLSFQKTSNPAVEEQLNETSERLLALASSLLKSASQKTDLRAPNLEDADDVDVHWTRVVDIIDNLLEKADTCLDDYTGLIKRNNAPADDSNAATKKPSKPVALDKGLRNANVLKPQDKFEVRPVNSSTNAWAPKLTRKPHAKISLDKSLQSTVDGSSRHPYESEIRELSFPTRIFKEAEPIKYKPIEDTSATFVDTYEGVLEMLGELRTAKEIAIDTEHHDFRTYQGLLSLMQISTRDRDWIVDTLQPWRHKLEVLNEVFADPNIIKVLHGAYMDIIWLQRDCGLYIVGLFDTYEASVSLGYPHRSLAYLLKKFVDFDADKKYQMADWRIRPLPEEMLYYARSDTHYLLYIYDMLRNDLVQKSDRTIPENDLISAVLDRSKTTSLRRFELPEYDAEHGQGPNGWFNLLLKHSSGRLTSEQFAVLRAMHQWRDELARREDESTMFVMSNSTLFNIARELPADPKALHSLLPKNTAHIVKRDAENLFKIIAEAKIDGANGPTVAQVFRAANGSSVGVGEVAKTVFPHLTAGNMTSITKSQDLVSEDSQLWGNVPISSRWEVSRGNISNAARMEFALPWAHFVENAEVGSEQLALPSESTSIPSRVKPEDKLPEEETEKADEDFTLRAGLKRKTPAPDSDSDSSSSDDGASVLTPGKASAQVTDLDDDEIAVPGSSDEEGGKQNRKARKAKKKAEKEAVRAARKAAKDAKKAQKKVEQANATESKVESEEEEAFDYSKAKSVLKRSAGAQDDAGKSKRFNPYSSLSAEGPKAARKMHGEKPGKSHTFKR
ncbi:ribonuclease H-like domain-containing protein [Microdochium trichocladiopsis]|uniref:Ribonuclease H-like domain-containing protein n=1 Tax=Microdochium trichocladiopsis TaxID=1682393 RepID=A0A9P8Y4B3_9PEZI|nr:ribonuclease H-like domain-containing protein [Microdochium trichocladiopsis]KAH7029134.1 ribonuclease H-like domain-containing protein [Microdochium trichocladiopsis]